MQREYQNTIIRDLRDQQMRFAPRTKKLQQVEAAERLISEVDPDKIVSIRIRLLPHHGISPGGLAPVEDSRRRFAPRPSLVR